MIFLPKKIDLMIIFIKCTKYHLKPFIIIIIIISLLYFCTNPFFTRNVLPKRGINNKKFGSHDQLILEGFNHQK